MTDSEDRQLAFKDPQDLTVRRARPELVEAQSEAFVGSVVAQKYAIESRVGEGGMSTIYRATDIVLKRPAAIKLLSKKQLTNETSLVRFQQEARAASNLNHAGIVTIYEFGFLEDEQPFLAMEFVDGQSLADILKRSGRFAPRRAAQIVLQACQALDHAHRRGVVHRDLKPSNIMLVKANRDDEQARIVDFGIAKIESGSAEAYQVTQTGEIFGSPLYMSPEQCRGKKADQRSDIYSLGCVLYEMLTGEPPLVGENVLDTMRRHVEEEPFSLSEHGVKGDTAAGLQRLLEKAMAKAPESRFDSMEEFASALERVLSGEDGAGPGSSGKIGTVARKAQQLEAEGREAEAGSPVSVLAKGSDRKQTVIALAFLLVTVAFLCASFFALSSSKHERSEALIPKHAAASGQASGRTMNPVQSAKERALQEAIRRAELDQGPAGLKVADALKDYANWLAERGERGRAEPIYARSTAIFRENGSPSQLFEALRIEGFNFKVEDKRSQAARLLLEAVELKRSPEYAHDHGLAEVLKVLGDIAREDSDEPKAITYYLAAVRCGIASTDPRTLDQKGLSEIWLADYADARNDLPKTAKLLEDAAQDLAHEPENNRSYIARAYKRLAAIYGQLNRPGDSVKAKEQMKKWENYNAAESPAG